MFNLAVRKQQGDIRLSLTSRIDEAVILAAADIIHMWKDAGRPRSEILVDTKQLLPEANDGFVRALVEDAYQKEKK